MCASSRFPHPHWVLLNPLTFASLMGENGFLWLSFAFLKLRVGLESETLQVFQAGGGGGRRTVWAHHPPYGAAYLTGALSPSQGSSPFPMGSSRSWMFRRVTRAPTAVWPPTQPASASARRPYSAWLAEVRGPAGLGNLGVSGVRGLTVGRGLRSPRPAFRQAMGINLTGQVR